MLNGGYALTPFCFTHVLAIGEQINEFFPVRYQRFCVKSFGAFHSKHFYVWIGIFCANKHFELSGFRGMNKLVYLRQRQTK